MNILVISSRFPYPPLKGDRIRAYYPIKQLSKKHNVDLISFSETSITREELNEMKGYCNNIDIVYVSKFYFLSLLVAGIATLIPSQVLCYKSFQMKQLIRRRTKQSQYDIVYIVCARISNYSSYISDTPVIVDWIDALSMSTERLFRNKRFGLKKLGYYWEWKKMKRFEFQQFKKESFYSIITSHVDKKYLADKPNAVAPNGVDTDYFKPSEVNKDIDLIFTGNMGYQPNIHAVQYFCDNVLPLLIKDKSEINFYIVGINPPHFIKKKHDGRNVFVTGFVQDISKYLNRSKIFVAPLQTGAGIQNKILEAFACSLPVVTTDFGNAGIQAVNDKEVIVRNEPEGIADAIVDLLSDSIKRKNIGANATHLVKRKFSWDSFTNHLEYIFQNEIANFNSK